MLGVAGGGGPRTNATLPKILSDSLPASECVFQKIAFAFLPPSPVSMDALSHIPSFSSQASLGGTHSSKAPTFPAHSLRLLPNFPAKTPSLRSAHPLSAVARDISDDGTGEPYTLSDDDNSVLRLVPQEQPPSLPQGNTDLEQRSENNTYSARPPLVVPHGSTAGGGTRAGLFRTPISGGVQNATAAHGLPRPSLAVRNLIEQARFAHLCTVMSRMHHRREGYPFGSLVDFAPDPMGHPIFSLSPLAIHTRNLLADPRCTFVVQIPGWSSLSNARVTIFGDVYPLPENQQEWAHKQYLAKHQQGPSQQWGNFHYFRMQNISDIYFVGGFGTVAWIDVNEYEALQPDKIAADGGEQNLKELNAIFSKPLKELLSKEAEVDDVAFISVDSKGVDIRVRQGTQYNVQRISFAGHTVETLEEAKKALWELLDRDQVDNLHK